MFFRLLCSIFYPLLIVSQSPPATIYKTIQGTNDRLTPYKAAFINSSDVNTADVDIQIDSSITYQSMLGFGGAFTGSSSYLFSILNETTQQTILNMYFGEEGNKYNMARLTIGSTDFSIMSYNYAPYPGDWDLTKFKLSSWDTDQIIPFIKSALDTFHAASYSNSTDFMFIASPWSAPGWMKENGKMTCGDDGCRKCKLLSDNRTMTTWSNYISTYITQYSKALNYNIYGITPQNEPYSCPRFYEGMAFEPDTEGAFIAKYLGPILHQNHPDLKIYIYDQNKKDTAKWVTGVICNNSEAAKYVSGTAVHWYDGDHFDVLNESHYLAPGYELLATEATESYDKHASTDPDWGKGEHYAHDMIGDLNNWVVGFIDWNLILDLKGAPDHAAPNLGESDTDIDFGSDAMLIVDPYKNEIYPQIFYWYFGHLSRFISKGDYRIEWNVRYNNTAKKKDDLEMTSFYNKNTEQVTVVILNEDKDEYTYHLYDTRPRFKGLTLNGIVPPHSIQTIVY